MAPVQALPWDILLITDEQVPLGLVTSAAAALDAGELHRRLALQFRAKRSGREAQLRAAAHLRALTRKLGVPLLINADLDLAVAVEADGIHLPSRGVSPRDARVALGAQALIGRSCHSREEIKHESTFLDYITLSPFFVVPGKGKPLARVYAKELIATARTPVLALGGIGPAQAAEVLAMGASGVAVIRSVLGAAQPATALRALATAMDDARMTGTTPLRAE